MEKQKKKVALSIAFTDDEKVLFEKSRNFFYKERQLTSKNNTLFIAFLIREYAEKNGIK